MGQWVLVVEDYRQPWFRSRYFCLLIFQGIGAPAIYASDTMNSTVHSPPWWPEIFLNPEPQRPSPPWLFLLGVLDTGVPTLIFFSRSHVPLHPRVSAASFFPPVCRIPPLTSCQLPCSKILADNGLTLWKSELLILIQTLRTLILVSLRRAHIS